MYLSLSHQCLLNHTCFCLSPIDQTAGSADVTPVVEYHIYVLSMTRMVSMFYAKILVTLLQFTLSTCTLTSTCLSESSLNLSLAHLVSASHLAQVLT